MKYVISFLLLFCIPFLAFSQNRALEKAVKKGKDAQNGTYFVEFDKHYDMRDIDNWFTKNSFAILQSKTINFPVFGDTKVGYRQIHFMTAQDYAIAQEKARRMAEEQRKNSNTSSISTSDIVTLIIGAAALYGGYKAIESGLSNSGSSSSSGSSTSQNNPSDCKTLVFVNIDVEGVTEDKSRFSLSGPSSVTIEEETGDGTNDGASVTGKHIPNQNRCTAGSYHFTYTWHIGSREETTLSGTFEIDGKNTYYDITIPVSFGKPTKFNVRSR
jgi:hypothetical protein